MTMTKKDEILDKLSLFCLDDGGIGSWLSSETDDIVFSRLANIDEQPLSKGQLNQLLTIAHEAPLSDGFFKYYWLSAPSDHPYNLRDTPDFEESWISASSIVSLNHLKWGLNRLYTDGLLWFGNVRSSYRVLRTKNWLQIVEFFQNKRYDTDAIRQRGPALPLHYIPKDERYLISEMACKSYGNSPRTSGELREVLLAGFNEHVRNNGGGRISIRQILSGQIPESEGSTQAQLFLSADEVLDKDVESREQLLEYYESIANKFVQAREHASKNTALYLSMVGDLDVYVATSMRIRKDFRAMADKCEAIFGSPRLEGLNIRYFDPTMSAAEGHEDKGLIECLMVKCARILVYCAGEKESYGKDAEAAMALSLGKPVIFLCDEEQKSKFYRDVHPLSRLIDFESGVAVGAMVSSSQEQVVELIARILENRMQYELQQKSPGYLRLKEKMTDSIVRLQTSDRLITQTFWNYYKNR